jgi:type I restriction enzyme S subunit
MSSSPRAKKKVLLRDVAFFQEGPGLRTHQWAVDGMKVINVTNIIGDGSVDVTNTDKFVALEEFETRYAHFAVEENDIVVASSGNTYGKVGRIRAEHLPLMMNTSVIRFHSGDKSRLDDDFLYAWLRSPEFISQVEGFVTGGAQPNFGPTHLKQMSISLPAIPLQKRIADVLSAYDYLIDNNRRRMALLEDAAQQLYREWFLRLRFPGHEHARIISGVPDGWRKATAHTAMEVLSGGTPKTTNPDYWNGGIPFYTPKDAVDSSYVMDTERSVTEVGLKNCNSRLYAPNTVFISARGTVGKLNLASQPMAMSQSCYALVGKGYVSQFFLFCALKEAIEHFKQHAVGAVFDAIVVDTFKLIPFMVPDERKVRLFEEAVAPVFRQIANVMKQNQRLRAARDLLLPRLMNGEIAV